MITSHFNIISKMENKTENKTESFQQKIEKSFAEQDKKEKLKNSEVKQKKTKEKKVRVDKIQNNLEELEVLFKSKKSLELSKDEYEAALGLKYRNRYNVIGRVIDLAKTREHSIENFGTFLEELEILRSAMNKTQWKKSKEPKAPKTSKVKAEVKELIKEL